MYPSSQSTKFFREVVKSLTNSSQINNSIYRVVLGLSSFIRNWDDYFIGGKTQVLKKKLDWYVAKRCRMFLFKKYKGKYGEKIQTFLKKDGKWNTLRVTVRNVVHSVPVMRKSKNMPFTFFENSCKLKNSSFIINPMSYFKKSLVISQLIGKKHAVLYYKQKGICPICSKGLINEFINYADVLKYESNFPVDVSSLNLTYETTPIFHELSISHLQSNIFVSITKAK